MSYSKIIKKTIFNIILLGVVSFAVLYVGVMFYDISGSFIKYLCFSS